METRLLLQLRDKKMCVILFADLTLQPLLVTNAGTNFSTPSVQELTVIGQKLVGVFVYDESARTLHFPSTAHFQNLAVVPGSRHLKQWSNWVL